MNNDRRKALNALVLKFDELRSELENLSAEEQEYFDNMPEGLQGGQKGEDAQTAIDALDEAGNCCTDAIEYIGVACSA